MWLCGHAGKVRQLTKADRPSSQQRPPPQQCPKPILATLRVQQNQPLLHRAILREMRRQTRRHPHAGYLGSKFQCFSGLNPPRDEVRQCCDLHSGAGRAHAATTTASYFCIRHDSAAYCVFSWLTGDPGLSPDVLWKSCRASWFLWGF